MWWFQSAATAAAQKAKEEEVMTWIRDILTPTGVNVPQGKLQDVLKDGIILCK